MENTICVTLLSGYRIIIFENLNGGIRKLKDRYSRPKKTQLRFLDVSSR